MADPISIAALVATLATLFVNLLQSIRENHFRSECFGCFSVEHDTIMQEKGQGKT